MRIAKVFVNSKEAGSLFELVFSSKYRFEYLKDYSGSPVSITMPISRHTYEFDSFPLFFDGLLPEGYQLEGLLKTRKIDRNDHFSQLVTVGDDLVGNTTVKEVTQ